MRRMTIAIMLVSIMIPIVLSAQSRKGMDKSFYYSYGEKFFTEAHAIPAESGDSIDVYIFFKIINDLLAFKQTSPEEAESGKYESSAGVEVECMNSEGIIKSRTVWEETIYVNSYEETNSKKDYNLGYIQTRVPNDEYKIKIFLLDEDKRRIKTRKKTIKQAKEFQNGVALYQPIFIESLDLEEDINSYAIGNAVAFGSKNPKALLIVKNSNPYDKFYFQIKKMQTNNPSLFASHMPDFRGLAELKPATTLALSDNSDSQKITFNTIDLQQYSNNDNKKSLPGLLVLDIPYKELTPGRYELIITTENKKDTLQSDFEVLWVNQPLSLKVVDYAARVMYYILTDEEHDELDSGSDEEIFDKIMKYWKTKDPTPDTPFNEAMAEYFRRVDYAFFNYQTISERDGANTDRGKIYILFGTPSSVSNDMSTGSSMEVWKYENLDKEFTFEMVSSGNFRLVDIKEEKQKTE